REDQPALLRARFEDLEDELLLAHPGGALHVEALGHLHQGADAHVLQRRQIQLFGRRRSVGPGSGRAVRLRRLLLRDGSVRGGVRRQPDFVIRSISFHSSSSPSPVTAETATTGCSYVASCRGSARARSARESLSTFVTAIAIRPVTDCSHRHASTSLASPGCRASTTSTACLF